MNSKFFDLKQDKQDRMINAALKIFALQGYRHASTDDIVKEAAISKGLLFHYFESKIGVYSFIYDYSVRYMTLELKSAVNVNEKNLFQIVRQIENAKIRALRGYPYMQLFLNKALHEDVSEALLEVEEKKNIINETYNLIYGQIDYSMFGDKISKKEIDMLLKTINYISNGLMQENIENDSFQPDMYFEETMEYIKMLEAKYMD